MAYNEHWSEYPEQKPTSAGYYITHYNLEGEKLTKAIWWSTRENAWGAWKFEQETPDVFEFVPTSRNDYYCPCLEAAEARDELWVKNV